MKKGDLVDLPEDERAQPRTLSARRHVRPSTRRKAQALLLVDAGNIDNHIAKALDITIPTATISSGAIIFITTVAKRGFGIGMPCVTSMRSSAIRS